MVDKIRKMSSRLSDELPSLPYALWIGHVSQTFDKCGVPRVNPIPEDYFQACIDGIEDSFYGGFEPEFSDEKSYNMYVETCEKIKKLEWITPTDTKSARNSPYKDKTIPYLGNP